MEDSPSGTVELLELRADERKQVTEPARPARHGVDQLKTTLSLLVKSYREAKAETAGHWR